MRKTFLRTPAFLLSVCVALVSSFALAQNPATTLESRDLPRYQEQKQRMEQGDVDLLWVGDSITHFWEGTGKEVWNKFYGDRKAMNFAISGDRTGHVLWRMANSPMDKISPKMTVVMIGTNNIGHKKQNSDQMHSTPEETVEGIQAIVDQLKSYYPETKILLLEVFPRDEKPDGKYRQAVNSINEGLRKIYADGAVENVQLYSINDLLLTKDGVLTKEIMPDSLHPSAAGYEIWANAIEPMIAEALGDSPVDVNPAPVDADWWRDRFNQKNEILKGGDVDILMVGDSITHGWEGAGAEQWQKYYGDKKAINLGIGGDQTQHVLWRLENYDFSKVNPKAAVLLIGVNNTWGNDRAPKDIALGQRKIVEKLRATFPNMKIFVLRIFPCTNREGEQEQIDSINALTPYYMRDLPNVEVLDIGKVFLNKDGVLTKDVMPDLLHPNGIGYESWGAALYFKLEDATR